MPKKNGKPVSLDAMYKAILQQYDIPTKQDINKIMEKLDRMEQLLKQAASVSSKSKVIAGNVSTTASGTVLNIVKNYKKGVDFARLQAKTGYDDKKLRNIIFRLHKIGKIKRKTRGLYIIT